MNKQNFTRFIKSQLDELGLDSKSDGISRTPERAFQAFLELTKFHRQRVELDQHLVFFPDKNKKQLIVVSRIFFASLCEHHLLPFFGFVDIGYVPNGKILGLSKFKRIIELITKQVTLQERLTKDIFDLFMQKLRPKGLIVHIQAKHTCVFVRGAKDVNSVFRTIEKSDHFDKNPAALQMFFRMIDSHGQEPV